ncbi:hypothetical protein Syun_030916 [Stephania yunnanensis]|uniref:non-specific serine/threonine protein kinase n=1 Tax=Stephania yunnanensis TaxID=152371 RepID=A0AAP0DVM4_9MAGN
MMLTLPISTKNCQANVAAGLIIGSHGNNQTDDQLALLAFKAQIIHGRFTLSAYWKPFFPPHHEPSKQQPLWRSSLEVGRLFRLRIFGLSNYSFFGEIPSNLSRCSNLQVFSIGYNKLSGIIPKELSSLQKLERHRISVSIVLLDNCLANMGSMSNLQVVEIGSKSIGKFSLCENNLHDHHERVSVLTSTELLDGFSPAYTIVHAKWEFGEVVASKVRSDVERYETENLNLSRRLDTAIDVASALEYLHNQCKISIIHCDLKPSNILLDEVMVARVGDFGLAKFLQRNKNNDSGTTNSTSSFSPRGTVGYILPGKRQTDELKLDGNEPHQDIQVINTESRRGMCEESGKVGECISSIVKVGVGCSMSSPSERMNIKDALKELLATKKFYESR